MDITVLARHFLKASFAKCIEIKNDFVVWELVLCVYSCKYINSLYLELVKASNIQTSNFGHARCRFLNFGIQKVMVVKNLDFADWPFPGSAAAMFKESKI